jgi:hypothetical protein
MQQRLASGFALAGYALPRSGLVQQLHNARTFETWGVVWRILCGSAVDREQSPVLLLESGQTPVTPVRLFENPADRALPGGQRDREIGPGWRSFR